MNILITRPSPYGEELVIKLIAIGKAAYHLPLIYFDAAKKISLIKEKLNFLQPGDFLFIISQNAVIFAHNQLIKMKLHWPSNLRYYTIGHQTSLKMYELSGILSKYPIQEENSENLLQFPELIQHISGRRALILTGNNGGRNFLKDTLQKRGASVSDCQCYSRKPLQYNGQEQSIRMLDLKINVIIVTTEGILKQLYHLIPINHHNIWLLRCRLIVVSLRLAMLARNLGWKDIIITKSANNNSILNTVIKNS